MELNAIIVAAIGLFASVATASLSFFFTKKHQLVIENRRLKENFYKSFIKSLSDAVINQKNEEAINQLSEGFNSLLIVGSTDVVEKLMIFHDFLKPSNNEIPRNSKERSLKHDKLLKDLIITMRKDLFGNEKHASEKLKNLHLVGN